LTGIYLIAAGVLFLMDFEQRCCAPEARRSFVFSGWISFCVLVYCLAASRLWSPRDPLMSAVHLTLPALGLGFFVLHGEWRRGLGSLRERGWRWLRLQSAFVCGVMLPVGSWLVWYWSEGALSALYEGLVVLPQRRLEYAGASFPGPSSFLISGVLGAFFFRGLSMGWGSRSQRPSDQRHQLLAIVLPCLFLVAGCLSDRGRLICFHAVRNLEPFVAAGLLVMLARAGSSVVGSRLFAAVATLVMGAMVQFPFALDSYFLYVVPLVFLGASLLVCNAAAASQAGRYALGPGRMLVTALCLFAFLELKSIVPLGTVTGVPKSVGSMRLELDRCGLTVERSLGDVYRRLVEEIQGLTGRGEAILAGPDCPEVYFLSNRRNPTRLFYDFFRPELLGTASELELLAEREGIRLVIVKQPFLLEFSGDSRALEAWARERFGEPRAFRFAGQPDSAGPVLFNVYADRSDLKAGELARRE
ncbi:MAG: hypothetical protein ACKO2L_14245, partial [Planctomycetaceae bacterium]